MNLDKTFQAGLVVLNIMLIAMAFGIVSAKYLCGTLNFH
jgi:hypothetical protein